jgi:hypothetical protein
MEQGTWLVLLARQEASDGKDSDSKQTMDIRRLRLEQFIVMVVFVIVTKLAWTIILTCYV